MFCLQVSLPEAITPRDGHTGGVIYGEGAQVHLVLHGGKQGQDWDHPIAATAVIDLGMIERGHSVSSVYMHMQRLSCDKCDYGVILISHLVQ